MTSTATPAHRSRYRELFAIPGALGFCVSGAFARLPMSTLGLAIVLALNEMYGNWAIAGTMNAVYIFAAAAVTPVFARLFDRLGQRRVGGVALAGQVLTMITFTIGVWAHASIPWLFALVILMGVMQFTFGALVRTRWAYVLRAPRDEGLLSTAYALEAAIDEMIFVLGPIATAFLATAISPIAALIVSTLSAGIGGAVFFALRDTQPPVMRAERVPQAPATDAEVRLVKEQITQSDADAVPSSATAPTQSLQSTPTPTSTSARPRARRFAALFSWKPLHASSRAQRSQRNVLAIAGVLPLTLMFVIFNMSFTAFDVSIAAAMKQVGMEHFLGLQLAMIALGSLMGALILGFAQPRGSKWRWLVTFLALMVVGFVALRLTMDQLVLLGIAEVLTGLFVSPIYTMGNLLIKDLVPQRSLTEGLAWLSTGEAMGASFGSSIAGVVVDASSPYLGMQVPWLVTACAVPFALLGWYMASRARAASRV